MSYLTSEDKHWSITLEVDCSEEVTFYWDYNNGEWEFSCVATDTIYDDHLRAPQLWNDDERGPLSYYEFDQYVLPNGDEITSQDIFNMFRRLSVANENDLEEMWELDDLFFLLLEQRMIEEK